MRGRHKSRELISKEFQARTESAMEPRLSKRQHAIKARAERLAPQIASFLSDLWKLSPDRFMPKEFAFHARDVFSGERFEARAVSSEGKIVLCEPVHTRPSVLFTGLLVHEMAHLGFEKGRHEYKTYRQACIGEGLAGFSEQEFSLRLNLRQKLLCAMAHDIKSLRGYLSWRHLTGRHPNPQGNPGSRRRTRRSTWSGPCSASRSSPPVPRSL